MISSRQRDQRLRLAPAVTLHPRQLEQVVDQVRHPAHRGAEVCQGPRYVGDHAVLEPLGQGPQPGQRSPQVVGHEADQLAARVLGGLLASPRLGQRPARGLQLGHGGGQLGRDRARCRRHRPGPIGSDVESATSRSIAAPSSAEPRVTRRINHQTASTVSGVAVTSAMMITVESCGDRNISQTLITTVVMTAATGSRAATISW